MHNKIENGRYKDAGKMFILKVGAAGTTEAPDKSTELTRMREVIDSAVTRPVPAHNITEKTGG